MDLTLDVGNSNICVAGYHEGENLFMARMATNKNLEADQYAVELAGLLILYDLAVVPIERVAIASVVPSVTPLLCQALTHFTDAQPLVLSRRHAPGIELDIDNPDELGADIIASAIAVRSSCPLPAVIIDMGTATKLTAIDAEGRLLGVAIAPGLFLSLNALVTGASLLAGISLDMPQRAIGRNSAESMKSGVVLGNAAMLDGMIDRFELELGEVATIVATGGAASFVVPHCRREIAFSDTLLMDGLLLALDAHCPLPQLTAEQLAQLVQAAELEQAAEHEQAAAPQDETENAQEHAQPEGDGEPEMETDAEAEPATATKEDSAENWHDAAELPDLFEMELDG